MNGKSKKKLKDIQLRKFKESQTDWPTIIKLLEWTINRKTYKPNDDFRLNF